MCSCLLCQFHINAIELLHQPNGILIDLRFCFCSCRVEVVFITGKVFAECFGDLTTAGIVYADKGYFLFHLNGLLTPMH